MSKKPDLPKDIEAKCNGIIHGASVAAGAAGAAGAQIPLADSAVITPIQIGMIIAIAKVFDRDLTKEAARGVLKGAGAAFIGRGISQVLAGWIPGAGNALNAATAASLTEAVGWMSASQFHDEWLKDGHSPNEKAGFSSKDTSDAQGEPDEERKHMDELCISADEFISGKKDAKGANKEEYLKLMEEMCYYLAGLPEDDPFVKKYNKLLECIK